MLIQLAPGGVVWPAAIMMWGPGYNASAHRHHCVQLLMTLHGSLLVRGGHDEAWSRCGAALVRPDALHQVDGRGSTVLIGFMDAESEVGVALSDRIDGDITCLPAHQVSRWRALLGWPLTEASVEQWVTRYLLRRRRPVNIDARVMRVVEHLRQRVAGSGDVSLRSLAAVAGLSSSRFMHLFTESIGVPPRPYILWLRLQRASSELMDGATVSQAAHRAGFSDAAHLNRTFRRMLGSTPTEKREWRSLAHVPETASSGSPRALAGYARPAR
jgi:AraC-like DNA-binding protein